MTLRVQRARDLGFAELVLWVLEINDAGHEPSTLGGAFRADGATKIDEGTPEGFMAERYHLRLDRGAP